MQKLQPGLWHVKSRWMATVLAAASIALATYNEQSAAAQTDSPTSQPADTPHVKTSGPFLIRQIKLADGATRHYALFVPPQYQDDPDKRWPVIVFLHGSGECGEDGIAHTRVGLPKFIASRPGKFPFITIMPQARRMWFRGPEAMMVWSCLDEVLREYRADPERIYLTGLSMGGFGTWEFAMWRPDVFAAAAPVCGVGNPAFASNLRHMPIWAFHGRQDDRVPVEGSREPIEALRLLGAEPKYTEYPDGNHFIWDRAYSNLELYRWMLTHRRRSAPRRIEYLLTGPVAQVWWLGARAEGNPSATSAITAEIGEDGEIRIDSTGVVAWSLVQSPGLLEAGQKIRVVWNGEAVFEGEFAGRMIHPPLAASRPAEATQPDAGEVTPSPEGDEAPPAP